jgi:hypothetical protein
MMASKKGIELVMKWGDSQVASRDVMMVEHLAGVMGGHLVMKLGNR